MSECSDTSTSQLYNLVKSVTSSLILTSQVASEHPSNGRASPANCLFTVALSISGARIWARMCLRWFARNRISGSEVSSQDTLGLRIQDRLNTGVPSACTKDSLADTQGMCERGRQCLLAVLLKTHCQKHAEACDKLHPTSLMPSSYPHTPAFAFTCPGMATSVSPWL